MIHSAPRPWLAFVLSLFCTGLGHVYAGRLRVGLVLFLVSLLFPAVALAAAALPTSTVALAMLGAGAAALVALYVGGAAHAWWVARGGGGALEPSWALVALFIAVGVTYPAVTGWLVRASAVEAFEIAAGSMAPTLVAGDRVLVTKLGRDAVRRGDVVCFRAPGNRAQHWVKRVVALPGDRVPAGDAVVPPGHCFVLGDARSNSHDSRHFGFVPLGDVVGRAAYVFWPADRWGRWGVVGAR